MKRILILAGVFAAAIAGRHLLVGAAKAGGLGTATVVLLCGGALSVILSFAGFMDWLDKQTVERREIVKDRLVKAGIGVAAVAAIGFLVAMSDGRHGGGYSGGDDYCGSYWRC